MLATATAHQTGSYGNVLLKEIYSGNTLSMKCRVQHILDDVKKFRVKLLRCKKVKTIKVYRRVEFLAPDKEVYRREGDVELVNIAHTLCFNKVRHFSLTLLAYLAA